MKIPDASVPRLHFYQLEAVSENPIPHDVLVEHLAVALRDLQFAGFTSIAFRGTSTTSRTEHTTVAHPFDNPDHVVFDDKPQLEVSFPEDPFPLTTRVIDALKEDRRG